jgi:hypothetical protein
MNLFRRRRTERRLPENAEQRLAYDAELADEAQDKARVAASNEDAVRRVERLDPRVERLMAHARVLRRAR